MNSENPYRDQAERLRRRIEKINDSSDGNSNLPPRSDLHRLKKKKTKWKIKYPVIRILVLFFILLPITIFSIYSYLDGKKPIGAEKTSVSSQGFEPINIEKPKKAKAKEMNKIPQNTDDKEIKQQNESNVNAAEIGNTGEVAKNNDASDQEESTAVPSNAKESNTQNTSEDKEKIIYHTVQPQETLFRIAMNYYHSDAGIEIIKQANHIQDNNIVTGQVLKIPLKK